MPGIIPRLKGLFTSGFGYIAFLMAQIYAMVRLLPPNHAYLNPQNIGQFTIRNVIAQAANHLVIKKENIDQMIIFATILIGIVLLIVQIAMIIFSVILEPALASFPDVAYGPAAGAIQNRSIFETFAPDKDIAFMLLDQVFGVGPLGASSDPFFNSCIAQGIPCGPNDQSTPPGSFPWPFHEALHELFQFYNVGILVIGTLIFLYFVVIVVGETAVTGTPFGQRFQNVWVPIRLVMAIGLLIPLNYGYNSGQYITLFAGKVGSSFATNGWILYNNTIREHPFYKGGAGANPTGERESLIGKPAHPDITPLIEAMSIVHTCAMSYWFTNKYTTPKTPTPPSATFTPVIAYLVKNAPAPDNQKIFEGTSYEDALEFYDDSDIVIRFGQNGLKLGGILPEAVNAKGNVIPHCGDIRIKIKQVKTKSGADIGPVAIQKHYYELVQKLWFAKNDAMKAFAYKYSARYLERGKVGLCASLFQELPADVTPGTFGGLELAINGPDCAEPAPQDWRAEIIIKEQGLLETTLNNIWTNYSAATEEIEMTQEILERGWAGAGIWYNTISQVNGSYMDAVQDLPSFDQYPKVMKFVRNARQQQEKIVEAKDIFCPVFGGATATPFDPQKTNEKEISKPLCEVYKYWNSGQKNPLNLESILTKDTFSDAMNLIFGTKPLVDMTKEGVKTHPLTQLAMLGKGLVDASIRNIASSSAGSAIGGLSGAFDGIAPKLIQPMMSLILSTAFVGLTAGLVLYYIVPFLPFIYFYFAVASWIKSIFEAMVGVPLWALAHLRLDGEGLPGNSAANGYFLILEIFLRPILTIFGLIAATLIFTAQVRVLNFLWQIVTENVSGFNGEAAIVGSGVLAFDRSIIDEFFFSIIYAIIVYMMAIAAFKLIDKIPDNLLRWMGSSVSSFGDINQDSVEGLTRYAALGGATAGQRLAGGVQQLSSESGTAVGGLFARLRGGG